MKKKRLGLVLGGGSARCIAHVGVLKVLLTNNIPIDYIAGTSMGGLFGALVALGMDIAYIEEQVLTFSWHKLIDFNFSKLGLVSFANIGAIIEKEIGEKKFRDIKIPLSIIATNLFSGKEEIFNDPEMELCLAIEASCAFPGLFNPVKIGAAYYGDGSAINNLPVSVVKKMGADVVLAVDVIPNVELKEVPNNFALVADRANDILIRKSSEKSYQDADVLLQPVNIDVSSIGIKHAKELLEAGEKAALARIDDIRKLIV
ncbi:patatin-like phospholipase family protein [Candidatus Margulisiibacteriota bacterium]